MEHNDSDEDINVTAKRIVEKTTNYKTDKQKNYLVFTNFPY